MGSAFRSINHGADVDIPLTEFNRRMSLILPNPYPSFFPKMWQGSNDSIKTIPKLCSLEGIQITVDPADISKNESESRIKRVSNIYRLGPPARSRARPPVSIARWCWGSCWKARARAGSPTTNLRRRAEGRRRGRTLVDHWRHPALERAALSLRRTGRRPLDQRARARGVIDLQPLEVRAVGRAHVGEQARRVLVEMQEGAGIPIEDPAALLLEAGDRPDLGQQGLKLVQSGGAGVFHGGLAAASGRSLEHLKSLLVGQGEHFQVAVGVAIGGFHPDILAEQLAQPPHLLVPTAVLADEVAGDAVGLVQRQAGADQGVGAEASGERGDGQLRRGGHDHQPGVARLPALPGADRVGPEQGAGVALGKSARLGLELGPRHAGQEPARRRGL